MKIGEDNETSMVRTRSLSQGRMSKLSNIRSKAEVRTVRDRGGRCVTDEIRGGEVRSKIEISTTRQTGQRASKHESVKNEGVKRAAVIERQVVKTKGEARR